jgi:hypothetical protein
VATIKLRRFEIERVGLPGVCMRCGAPATIHKDRRFSWYPPWLLVTILAGLLIFAILVLILTKRMLVSVPLCDAHRKHWSNRNLFNFLAFLTLFALVVGAGVLTANVKNDSMILVAWLIVVFVFFAWLVGAAIAQTTVIRPTEITDRSITLTGVAKQFSDAVLDERDRREQEEEEYYDRPASRRKRLESDQYYDSDEPRLRPPRRARDDDY